MKPIFPAAWLLICLLGSVLPASAQAQSVQEKPTASTPKKNAPASKTAPANKTAAVKKRPPVASKSKPASEVVKTPIPSADLDLSLPKDMVEELKPVGTVPLPKREPVLPEMFGDKNNQFQINGKLINNEMQLQLRNEERREVEGAALEFEFKR
ncbi:translation initiation factor 2 [Pseudomonas sp. YuFO20]|uniref:translation initiation factor 2 n=1 Tax=Pseudomonas sp. YuFO20 TaxID=3095362 RepID=UPI002B253345|nr:translation initiation factor 2 [Pseudomonas sp. YuFO20]MEB2518370.1 translation initiation factor 2 [Pseudomonas sp. YuFO20]